MSGERGSTGARNIIVSARTPALAGCGGSQKVADSWKTTASTGKQLEGLQRTPAAQAITPAEYEMLRKKILNP